MGLAASPPSGIACSRLTRIVLLRSQESRRVSSRRCSGAVDMSYTDAKSLPQLRMLTRGSKSQESTGSFDAAQHRTRVTVAADRHDLTISYVNMLGKRNAPENRVD